MFHRPVAYTHTKHTLQYMRVCTSVCISMTYSFVDLSFVVDKERLVLINTVVCLALECILEVGGARKGPQPLTKTCHCHTLRRSPEGTSIWPVKIRSLHTSSQRLFIYSSFLRHPKAVSSDHHPSYIPFSFLYTLCTPVS